MRRSTIVAAGFALLAGLAAPAMADGPGPTLVLDINPNGSSELADLTEVGDLLFFTADDGTHDRELWVSDGTEAGTYLVKDINPAGSSREVWWEDEASRLTAVGDRLFFKATDGIHGEELWVSDGTEAGTSLVKDMNEGYDSYPAELVDFGGRVFFKADDGIHGPELWASDGTEAGTTIVKDIIPGPGGSHSYFNLTPVGDSLFFVYLADLWMTDGTEDGTVLVKDVNPTGSSAMCCFAEAGDRLFFRASDGTHGRELWVSDGTAAGTDMVKDVYPGTDPYGEVGSSYPMWLTEFGDLLAFTADDGTHGRELWISDGTETGTVLVKDIRPSWWSASPTWPTEVGGALLFYANDGTHGGELWITDGTEAGTAMVKDINPFGGSVYVGDAPAVVGDELYFSASDGVNWGQLWVSDGTDGGTAMVAVINPSGSSFLDWLTQFDGNLAFSADDGIHGQELWIMRIVQEVTIDIEPQDDANIVRENGRVTVAVFSTDAFDTAQVDMATVGFGPLEAPVRHWRLGDIDRDGDTDLQAQFKMIDTGLSASDSHACLDGETSSGIVFVGCDSITIRSTR